jgi:hypothetical protein
MPMLRASGARARNGLTSNARHTGCHAAMKDEREITYASQTGIAGGLTGGINE